MRQMLMLLITVGLISCNEVRPSKMGGEHQTRSLESLAHSGISIDFKFTVDQPTFGDLFLIVGFENPDFPPNSREFERLKDLGFEQVDDYFGIRNDGAKGDDVKIWLFPTVNGESVYHNQGPFDGIRLTYVVVRNDTSTAELFETAFSAMTAKLDVTPLFEGQRIENYNKVKKTISETINYCRQELKVEPGSDDALQLEW